MELHPAIVHFPIAFLMLAGLVGLLSLFVSRRFWKDLAVKCLVIGLIFTPLAVLTGLIAEQNLKHNEAIHAILVKHKVNGFVILSVFSILTFWHWVRRNLMGNKEYITWVITLFLGSTLVLFQGYWGGKMVYEEGAGVKPMESVIESQSGKEHGHDEKNTKEHDRMKMPARPTGGDAGKKIEEHDMKGMERDKNLKTDSTDKTKKLKDMKY